VRSGLRDGRELFADRLHWREDGGGEGVYCAFDIRSAYFSPEGGRDSVNATFCFYEFGEAAGVDEPGCVVVEAVLGLVLADWLFVPVQVETRLTQWHALVIIPIALHLRSDSMPSAM